MYSLIAIRACARVCHLSSPPLPLSPPPSPPLPPSPSPSSPPGRQAIWQGHHGLSGTCGSDHGTVHSVGTEETKTEVFCCCRLYCRVSGWGEAGAHPHTFTLTLSHPHTLTLTLSPPHSEESTAIPGVGVDMLMKDGKLDHLKNGPIYWVDSADVNPCMGEVM